MKRLVKPHDQSNRSLFMSKNESPRQFAHAANGFCLTQVWAAEEVPVLPAPGGNPTLERYQFFSGPGGTPFLIEQFPPVAARGIDGEAASQEFFAHFPGLAEPMEPDNPGMHASHTVDYGAMLAGEVDLELDDRVVKRLKAGGCYVQNVTRFTWWNPSDVVARTRR